MMNPARIDRLVSLCPVFITTGLLIVWLVQAPVTATMLIGLGAMGGSLRNWREEGGLWMPAGFFLLIFGFMYLLLAYHDILDLVQGRAPLVGWMALDMALGTWILGLMIRFLKSVMVMNHQVKDQA